MTVLSWVDQDGDPVAVDAARIVGLSVGKVNTLRAPEVELTVTLVWTDGPQPFMVSAPFADVLRQWTNTRGEALTGTRAHPTARPLIEMQYPDGVRS